MRISRGVLLLFIPVLFCAHLLFWPGSAKEFVSVDVVSGASAHQVANKLKEVGLIQSPYPFLVWARLRRADSKIRVGRYQFSKGRAAFWIVDDILQGRTQKVKLVIPEGFASWQIEERLGELNICDAAEFKKVVAQEKLEGYLFPATYDFDFGMDAAVVAHVLKSQFEKAWTPEMAARAKELGRTQKEVVTLASIIEREVMVRDELPMVSAVYSNRLRRKMNLEADPTVQYALGFWKKRLTYDDYKHVMSPYNTYLNAGLPPGPICSPGVDSIKAALWPAQSDALFLLGQEDGHHNFSTNYREHANKVNKRNKQKRAERMGNKK